MFQYATEENCLSNIKCHKWYQHFKLGRIFKDNLDDLPYQWRTIAVRILICSTITNHQHHLYIFFSFSMINIS